MFVRVLMLALGFGVMSLVTPVSPARATEITLLSVNGVKLVLPELVAAFEARSGNKVSIGLGEAGVLRAEIEKGRAFDVVILPKPAVAQLATRGIVAAKGSRDFVRAPFGLAVRRGGPRPDTESSADLKRFLLAAKSVAFTDPATGGVSGVFFARVLDDLGIKQDVLSKARLTSGVLNAQYVALGETEIAVQMKQEILAVPGVEFVEFPGEYRQSGVVVFSAGIGAGASAPQLAQEFVDFITSPAASAILQSRHFEPAQ